MIRVYLIVVGGAKGGMVIPAVGRQFLIGRTEGCHLLLKKKKVSPKHCAILTETDVAFIEDLGSADGTRLNEELIYGQHELKSSDRLKIGEVELEVLLMKTEGGADDFPWANKTGNLTDIHRWIMEHGGGDYGDWAALAKKAEDTKSPRKKAKRKKKFWRKSNIIAMSLMVVGGILITVNVVPASTWKRLYETVGWSWIFLGLLFLTIAAVLQSRRNY